MKRIALICVSIFVLTNNIFSQNIIKENNPDKILSKVWIGNGARVMVDKESSAKLWYDDVVLSNGGRLQESMRDNDEAKLSDTDVVTTSQVSLSIPTELEISRAYPNPFNPVVSISYGLPLNSDVSILIHDLSGRKITEYNQNGKTAGWHEFRWDATDGQGNGIGSGVYLLTIQASDMVKKQKLTFIK